MQFSIETFIAFIAGALFTVLAGWVLGRRWLRVVSERAKNILEMARKEGELSARESLAQARVEMERERSEWEQGLRSRQAILQEQEKEMQARRDALQQEMAKLREQLQELEKREKEALEERGQYEESARIYRQRLQILGEMTPQEARELLREEVRNLSRNEIEDIRREILFETETEAREEARRILIDTMQRITVQLANEVSGTLVRIPNEEMKGRIIGREGRNIKTFELATGATLMIDETPGSILVSSFDPVRREVARRALEELIRDGRIHPVSIEETVQRVMEEMKRNVIELGHRALDKLHISNVHPEIVSVLGKLYYRLSNNQNTLDHSVEVASLCSLLASELGLDPDLAKRCGLFHDMGKAIEHEYEGSHALAAARLLQRYNEDERVVNAVACSHGEVEPTSIYAGLLKVADSISAARPGARADSMDGYIQRVRSLEALALSFEGIQEAYAVQAGREIRIIVNPEKVDDLGSSQLARKIRRRIEDELQYPGTIKVTVIREQRFVETAR